jgi:acetylornithine deacetylase/succinyl-diaminopimelate desuccinylase-like protein
VTLSLHPLRVAQHTAFAPILRSAPLELMRAVASLTGPDGRLVPGLQAEARVPEAAQLDAVASIPLPHAAVTVPGAGIHPFAGEDEDELRRRLVFDTSLSVSRMIVGVEDSGVVPAEAEVTIRLGLVPDQEPPHVLAALRAHLDAHGFGDVALEAVRELEPSAAPLDGSLARATIAAAAAVYGEPVIYPVLIGAGPGRMVSDLLGAPTVSAAGTLRPDGNMHGPDEHGAVEDYLDHVRFTVELFERLAADGF